MSKKQVFAKVGAILGIVGSAFAMIGGICMIFGSGIINAEFVLQVLAEEGMMEQQYIDYLDMIVTIAKAVYIGMGLITIGIAIPELILSIKVIKQANANKLKKGTVIALLVVSVLSSNLITLGFMITTLCLRDKVTVEPTPAGMSFNE